MLIAPLSVCMRFNTCVRASDSGFMHDQFLSTNLQILDGETIREWMEPAYTYFDGTGFGHPWELLRLSNYTLRTKSGEINGYASQFQMAVSYCVGTPYDNAG